MAVLEDPCCWSKSDTPVIFSREKENSKIPQFSMLPAVAAHQVFSNSISIWFIYLVQKITTHVISRAFPNHPIQSNPADRFQVNYIHSKFTLVITQGSQIQFIFFNG
ncbi:hypothetical protein ILYODFUR_016060 [Ilyodon furcidens]|uniref:Uncharacterized protein n=1 Tax=Ilyodon furcidens TaxID=33524 RepID=A0ABV0TJA9_9TELE